MVQNNLPLPPGEVHIYEASFKRNEASTKRDILVLSEDERERANRYRFEKDKLLFIFRRSLLRKLLHLYTGQRAPEIRFDYGKYGKPCLKDSKGKKICSFNSSHSREKVLFAFCASGPVGVDLEYMRRELDFNGITKRFFSKSEQSAFFSLPEASRTEAFFNCWTRKEAFIKAIGKGLSIGLGMFDVSLRPGEPAQLLCTRFDKKDSGKWSLYELETSPGFKAALAAGSKRLKLIYFDAVV